MKDHSVYHGDCFERLATLSDKSVDLILTDPPYGHRNKDGDLLSALPAALPNQFLLEAVPPLPGLVSLAAPAVPDHDAHVPVGKRFVVVEPLCGYRPAGPGHGDFLSVKVVYQGGLAGTGFAENQNIGGKCAHYCSCSPEIAPWEFRYS